MAGLRWSVEHDRILSVLYPFLDTSILCDALGRGTFAVRGRAVQLGLSKKKEDFSGAAFYEWTVLREVFRGARKNGDRLWLCRCRCGEERIVQQFNLIQGLSRSCGHKNRNLIGIVIKGAHFQVMQAHPEANLTIEQLSDLYWSQRGRCDETGLFMSMPHTHNLGRPAWDSASVDAREPSRPHSIDNLRWVTWAINRFKGDMSWEEWTRVRLIVAKILLGNSQ